MRSPLVEFAPEVEAFRTEVRNFFAERWTPQRWRGRLDPSDLTGVEESLERELLSECGQRGWLGISAPKELGGGGKPSMWQAAFAYEAAYHDAPVVDTAVTLAGSAVFRFADQLQRATLVPQMLSGEVIAAIAYSEASAGTDLAAISCRAVLKHGSWTLNGEKTHVTAGHKADWCLTLVRTSEEPAPRRAMTLFVVPMHLPGISVERVPLSSGWTLSTLRFQDVQLPPSAVLGDVGGGYAHVLEALQAERSGMFWLGWAARLLDDLLDVAPRNETADRCLAECWLDLRAAWLHARAVLHAQDQGVVPPALGAAAKVVATEALQRLAQRGSDLLGRDGLALAPPLDPLQGPNSGRVGWEMLDRVRESISVGPNEMHRAVLARSLHNEAAAAGNADDDAAAGRLSEVSAGIAAELSGGRARVAAVADESGHCVLVPNLEQPQPLVVLRAGEARLLQPEEYTTRRWPSLADETTWAVQISGSGERLSTGSGQSARNVFCRHVAAAQLAVAEAALARLAARAAQHRVFNQPLDRMGAVQEQMAAAALATAAARAAAQDMFQNPGAGDSEVTALALANRAALVATQTAQQIGGAAGLAAKEPLHRWYRRARVLRQWLGRPEELLDEIAARLRP